MKIRTWIEIGDNEYDVEIEFTGHISRIPMRFDTHVGNWLPPEDDTDLDVDEVTIYNDDGESAMVQGWALPLMPDLEDLIIEKHYDEMIEHMENYR